MATWFLVEWWRHRDNADPIAVKPQTFPSRDDAYHWATSHSTSGAWVLIDDRGRLVDEREHAADPPPAPDGAEEWKVRGAESAHRKAHHHYLEWRALVRAKHGV